MMAIEDLIISYSRTVFTMVDLLSSCHETNASVWKLYRILRVHGMGRKNGVIDTSMMVLDFISNQLLTIESHTWYPIMHQRLGANKVVYREPVRVELTLSLRRSLSHRNQSIYLQSKSMDWFLYYRDVRHERVKVTVSRRSCIQESTLVS